MSLFFASYKGEAIEVKEYITPIPVAHTDSPSPEPASPRGLPSQSMLTSLSMASNLQIPPRDNTLNQFLVATPLNSPPTYHETSCPTSSSPKPIITVTDPERLPASPNMAEIRSSLLANSQNVHKVRSVAQLKYRKDSDISVATTSAGVENPASWMVYNEYGELVTLEQMSKPIVAEELTVTQALRLVYKMYHAEFKDKMREVLSPLLEKIIITVIDDSDPTTINPYINDRLYSSWTFSPSLDHCQRQILMEAKPEEDTHHAVPVYSGPPRVLDIGCADGRWCDWIKSKYPDWIVEGVDDNALWSKSSWEGNTPRDFMEPLPNPDQSDYFCNVHLSQKRPEFTCRNINQLLSHQAPIPQNLYSLIRGRDVFDRVGSYKNFLEDIRHLLQPSGVVEFVEVDPRPRCKHVGRRHLTSDHRSGAETDWSDIIVDRFKDPYNAQLATNVPEWTARVEERLKASLRPRDGVPAANIKGWLQGAGFWHVKQLVIRLPVGGETPSGQKLADLMTQELEIESSIPILAAKLLEVNLEDINSGNFYLNLHIVTARKPNIPRSGDF